MLPPRSNRRDLARSPWSATPGRSLPTLVALVLLCALALGLGGCGRRGRTRTRASIEALAADPARDSWQQPAQLLQLAGIDQGKVVVDWASGDGYLLPHLSAAVGATGSVVAVELESDLVQKLRARVAASKLGNVSVHEVHEGELPGSGSFDAIMMLDSYGALAEPVGTLERLRGRLKVGGVLVVVGHKLDESVPGPPLDERLDVETIVAEARGAGFGEPRRVESLPRQWMVVLPNEPAPGEVQP